MELPLELQGKIHKVEAFHLLMDNCHHGFQRETCQLCRMEMVKKPPVKIVDDLREYELVHPTARIKDNLSKLNLPDITIPAVEPPESLSVDPPKPIINQKTDLITSDDLQVETEIIDPKKKFLMKKK